MTKLIETEIPDWAEWMAQDEDGAWYVYENQPVPDEPAWYWSAPGGMAKCGDSGKDNPRWKSTLHKLEEK